MRFLVAPALFVAPALLVAAFAFPKPLRSEAPPNVVFIIADDLGWGELGCYGQRKIPTPHIDRIASQGMRFTQHYSGAPVCAPSRCVLMTGRHLGHAEIRGNRQAKIAFPEFTEGQHPISAKTVTLADAFHRAGYATAAMGKWGLGPVGSTGDPNDHGFDLFFGYNCQSVAHSYYPRYLWRNREQIEINPNPISGHSKVVEGDVSAETYLGEVYAPDRMAAEAVAFIQSTGDKPFFLYLPFIEPHVAMHPPLARVEQFPEEWDREVYRAESGYLPHPRPRAGYAAMIAELDDYVGRVMAAIEARGVTDKTLVIFTSDNGTTHAGPTGTRFHIGGADPEFFHSTGGLRGYKGSVYEGGIRVPMIARYPGKIPANSVNHTPCYFADWFPTLCEVADLELPSGLDGQSMWSWMQGKPANEPRKPLLWVFPEYSGQVAVRMGDWKVVRQELKKPKSSMDWEVYNLASDPGELHNVVAEHPDLVQQAIQVLKREVAENEVFPLKIPGVNDAN